jgi:hypothetical protein
VRDGDTGVLVRPGEAGALANAIVSAMEDRASTAAMGLRARSVAELRDPEREWGDGIARLAEANRP